MSEGLASKTGVFLKLIRFEHTLFALPYAVAGAVLAAEGWPKWQTCLWITVAMIGARTAAMSFNRLVDRRFDATNERTAKRASVTGEVSPRFMIGATLLSSLVFVGAAWALQKPGEAPWALWLSLPTLFVLLGYSLCKRIFDLPHLILGLALGLSPLGAWLAVRGEFDIEMLTALWLGLTVLFWTTGFDIVYALQDIEHDRREGLKSLPARLGVSGALNAARIFHLAVPICLVLVGRSADLGLLWFLAVGLVALLLVVEHYLVRGGRMGRIQEAFFTVNIAISFIVMAAAIAEVFVARGSA